MISLSEGDRLARLVRAVARGQHVLFHGTHSPEQILRAGKLYFSDIGAPVVCLTRSVEEAVYWATSPRDCDDGRGAIFVLDRRSLRARYRIEPYHDPIWNTEDEMEERIWCRDVDLAGCLLALVSTPKEHLRPAQRKASFDTFSRLRAYSGRKVR
jgi:hypothetical protein